MCLLEIKNLYYYYTGQPAIKDVSLSIEENQIVSLLGENGSGKSTIIKLIAGLLDKASGDIHYKNEPIKGPSEQLIPGHPKIKTIFQDYRLAHRTTVYENIHSLHPPLREELKKEKTEKILRNFQLYDLAGKAVEALSGGEKQRVAIARAVVNDPEILLMDEPFSNLDAHNKQTITNLLFDYIRDNGISAIFVTHDYRDALKYSDQLCIMRNGAIIQQGDPKELYYHPINLYAATLLGPVNMISEYPQKTSGSDTSYVRPENIQIQEDGPLYGVVTRSDFAGARFEITIATGHEDLLVYSSTPLTIGQGVRFAIIIKNEESNESEK